MGLILYLLGLVILSLTEVILIYQHTNLGITLTHWRKQEASAN